MGTFAKFAIFDLDNTLVDSNHLREARDRRKWREEVYPRIGALVSFPEIPEMWAMLRRSGIYLAVVTHSPRPYATRVLEHLGLEPNTLVAYHDLQGQKKPSPVGYSRAIAGVLAEGGVGCAVGDEEADLTAAERLPCLPVVAGWARDGLSQSVSLERGWRYLPSPLHLGDILETMR